jgi:hypothetical protein
LSTKYHSAIQRDGLVSMSSLLNRAAPVINKDRVKRVAGGNLKIFEAVKKWGRLFIGLCKMVCS